MIFQPPSPPSIHDPSPRIYYWNLVEKHENQPCSMHSIPRRFLCSLDSFVCCPARRSVPVVVAQEVEVAVMATLRGRQVQKPRRYCIEYNLPR